MQDPLADLEPPKGSVSGAERLGTVEVKAFRSIRQARFEPGPLTALVGQPGAGKSNLLAAIRSVLDPEAAPLLAEDQTVDLDVPISITVETEDGLSRTLAGRPPEISAVGHPDMPRVLFLPAALRAGEVVAPISRASESLESVSSLIRGSLPPGKTGRADELASGSAEAAHGLVDALERLRDAGSARVVLLIEEPELFLPPQLQRYLYRLLREVADAGSQVLYSTHSPSFLNVARLEELVLADHVPGEGTRLVQPEPLPADDEFRAYSEFDATRSELFLARAAVLVEGLTERVALPFVFRALGYDVDRERISIVECGGKSNIPLIGRISRAAGVPFVAVHDRDAPPGKKPNQGERYLNRAIVEVAGDENRVQLIPDFEGVVGLSGHRHKPAQAWRSFAQLTPDEIPEPLARIVHRAVALARP